MKGEDLRYLAIIMAFTLACSLFVASGCSIPASISPIETSDSEYAELSTPDIESPLELKNETDGNDLVKVEAETASDGSIRVIIAQAVEAGTVPIPLSDANSDVSEKDPSEDTSSPKSQMSEDASPQPETGPSSIPPETSAPERTTVKEPETIRTSETQALTQQPETQTPTTQAPEITQPPTAQPPTTQLPETQPPETQPPETQPSETQLSETQPSETTAPPHVHSYTSTVTKQPTCRETGVRTYTCACGNFYTETIPMTDHHYVEKKEESAVTVVDSEEFTVDVVPCIPRYFVSYKQNEDGTWDFLGTWQDTMRYGIPETEWFYGITENYEMENGHNSNELIAYMRSAGYRYIYTGDEDPADACWRWLMCIGEFSDGPKNPDHGFREGYGPCWWVSSWDITVPAVTHQETVTSTYCECSVCGHRK